ncbi:tyrosine-type recombinase/integrase [Achromobacter spanius]|uniref:tyrosine-type recombinase/integrase n=1 Tax=Achromobacter spanius TaxID=217203 RepID=UPI003F692851
MPLSDTACRQAKPADKPYKLSDGGGLYLLINKIGKYWRWDYRHTGKRKTLAVGVYPDTGLAKARERHQDARKLLAEGIDPSAQRKADKQATALAAAHSFEAIAREWFAKQATQWAESHSDKVMARLERDLFPWLGPRPILEITAPELLKCLTRIEQRGAIETAHRALQNFGQVARYAVQTGRAERDVSHDLRGALTPWRPVQYAHVVEPEQIAVQLRKIYECAGTFPVICALRLVPMLFARTGELRHMRWADINLDAGQWCYTVSKTGRQHIASLSSQAVEILRELQPLTGHHEYVFPGSGKDRDQPISSNAILQALRRAGIDKEEQTVHGYRHTASVRLNEMGGWNPDAVEAALTHKMPGVRGVYAGRAQYLDERRKMMQAWSDYLDVLRVGINVVPLARTA